VELILIDSLESSKIQHLSSEISPKCGDRGIFWMKDGAPPNSWNRESSTVERYQSLRDRALAERVPGLVTSDMNWLYEFWSHFLVRNFNFDMYLDFYSSAWEDAISGYEGGLDSLNQYYGALLTGQRVLTERLAEDIVKLAESERNEKRPTLQKLRSAWRNGAFNLKSRKLIDKFISAEVKAELEK
jgi:la-related protein 1